MTNETIKMIREWLNMHRGDVEGLARWMSKNLRVGRKSAREMILEAVA